MQGHNGSTVTNPTVPGIEQSGLTSQDDDDDSKPTVAPPRKSRLSAPQLQAQLSLLSDRTRLQRLKHTLHTNGAWQVTRIEELCHAHVSHESLHHLDACAGSDLTPYDYITNVQKRLGNRAYTGFVNAVCVDHSWTLNLNPVKPAAPLKPPGDTMHALTSFQED